VEHLTRIDHPPSRQQVHHVVQSWDTAIKDSPSADFSVGSTWGYADGIWYLLDLVRVRLEYPELKALVQATQKRWRADQVLIEAGGTGTALASQLRIEGIDDVAVVTPHRSKIERLNSQLDFLQSPRVCLPTETPWWPDLVNELRAFPNGRYDDQVDSIAQALQWIRGPRGQGFLDTNLATGRPHGRRRR
jgi:predicted phage terminase large subunit-like protein